jgi:hypothetical protein
MTDLQDEQQVKEDKQRARERYKQELREHAQFMEERDKLIDAAREGARTFDKAVLTFGSAVFGASIAFIKDVAPNPELSTLIWLGGAWFFFSLGLLAVILSFLFSQKACMFEIDVGAKELESRRTDNDYLRRNNHWSFINTTCNYLCVAFLFGGLVLWSVFAFKNLAVGASMTHNLPTNPSQPDTVKKSYTPQKAPPPPPSSAPQPTTPPPQK